MRFDGGFFLNDDRMYSIKTHVVDNYRAGFSFRAILDNYFISLENHRLDTFITCTLFLSRMRAVL